MSHLTDRDVIADAWLQAENAKLRQQRDELLAACKATMAMLKRWHKERGEWIPLREQLERAIAKAEAQR